MSAPPRRHRLSTVGGSPWAVMLRHAGAAALGVLCLAVLAAAVVDGSAAAGSAALAGAAVLAPFAATGLLLWAASRRSVHGPPLAMVTCYVVLVLLGAALLVVVDLPGWIRPGWVLTAAILLVAAWLAGTALGLRRARLPIYDLPAPRVGPRPRDEDAA